ncbi:HAMP domain-containing histidine kinase [Patescibacteria group bacterium]|nr:HAMP domain-containing histidine kinase [Patescibacteria group bacterium]
MEIDSISVLVVAVAVLNILYGLVVYARNSLDGTSRSFFILTICVSLWGVSMVSLRAFTDPIIATWSARALYASAAMIPLASLYFAYMFPSERRHIRLLLGGCIALPFLAAFFISLWADGLIQGVTIVHGVEPVIHFNFVLHAGYVGYIVSYFLAVFVVLFYKYGTSRGVLRAQIAYILVGTLITTGTAVGTNLLLPFAGNYTLNWVGQVGTLAMITSIMYAILKHHLFSVKIIGTEIIVCALCLVLFSQIFATPSFEDRVLASLIFVAAMIIGYLLVKSVSREVGQREEIERLYEKLERTNERLTELDRLKSQFLSIASHELRAPLTIVRNFMSIMLEGSYGKIPPAAEEAGRQVFERVTDMTRAVDTYLNVSRIEQGKITYAFAPADLSDLVTRAVADMRPHAERKGLELEYQTALHADAIRARVDAPKITEIVTNLIDNAIRYTPRGSITVSLAVHGGSAVLSVQDTGVGMTPHTQKHLFKLFTPGENAKTINPASTGVGLFVSRAHAEAHRGTLVGRSRGVGEGSTFVLTIPLAGR